MANAAKVLLYKQVDPSVRGRIAYAPIDPEFVTDREGQIIADYGAMVLTEIDEARLTDLTAAADAADLQWEVRRDYDEVAINGYRFPSGTRPDLPDNLTCDGFDGRLGLYLVQLPGPPIGAWKDGIAAFGEVLGYYPENTYLMRMAPARAGSVAALPYVQHLSPYEPAFKIRRELLTTTALASETDDAARPAVLVVADGVQDLTETEQYIRTRSEEAVGFGTKGARRTLIARLSAAEMIAVANRPEVLWIERAPREVPAGERHDLVVAGEHNDTRPNSVATSRYYDWLEAAGFCTPFATLDCISLTDVKVGVIDQGLDLNRCQDHGDLCDDSADQSLRNPDTSRPGEDPGTEISNQGPFFCYQELVNGNPDPNERFCQHADGRFWFDDASDSSHGSSVASIIAGVLHSDDQPFPVDPEGYYQGIGVAPGVQIVVGKTRDASGASLPALDPDQLEALVGELYGAQVRLANSSWGAGGSEYTELSRRVDQLVRDANNDGADNKNEMTLVWAAGNLDVVDSYVRSPANAKNVITVGASTTWESIAEMQASSQNNELRCRWCVDPQDPSFPCEDQTIGDIHSQSRRGYVDDPYDVLFKPDIVAPSYFLEAARSTLHAEYATDKYQCFGGTSAAAPMVTGAATLVREWYYHENSSVNPSPAMIKAILVAHADSLEGGVDRFDDSLLDPSPSIPQGWGRVNLDAVFDEQGPARFYDDQSVVLNDSQSVVTYQCTVDDPSKPVIAVLAYSDAPAEPGAGRLLVNDVKLGACGIGSGHQYCDGFFFENKFRPYGWHSQRYNQIEIVFMSQNNVKVLRIDPSDLPPEHDFHLEVRAPSIKVDAVPGSEQGQDYALYVYNATRLK